MSRRPQREDVEEKPEESDVRSFADRHRRLAVVIMALGVCAGTNTPLRAQPPQGDVGMDSGSILSTIQSSMAMFERHLYAPAKASGGAFPAYNAWLKVVSTGIENDNGEPANMLSTSAAADRELAPFFIPFPPTRDTGVMAGNFAGSHLEQIGGKLIAQFHGQPTSVKLQASVTLTSRYPLPSQ